MYHEDMLTIRQAYIAVLEYAYSFQRSVDVLRGICSRDVVDTDCGSIACNRRDGG
jgi:hypothetical protein